MSSRDFREMLAQELLATARWRRDSARERPGDRRHAESAQALERLAEYVRSLPEDDPRFAAMRGMNDDAEFLDVGDEATRQAIDRFGFEESAETGADFERFLDHLTAAAVRDGADTTRRLSDEADGRETRGR